MVGDWHDYWHVWEWHVSWHTWVPIAIGAGALLQGWLERRDRRAQDAELSKRVSRTETAHLWGRFIKFDQDGDGSRFILVKVSNAGPAVARDIRLRVTGFHQVVSGEAMQFKWPGDEAGALAVGDSFESKLYLPNDVDDKMPLDVSARWTDDGGIHENDLLFSVGGPQELADPFF